MGLDASAELAFGIQLKLEYDDEDKPLTPLWNEEDEDWYDLPALLATANGATNPWSQVPHEINHGGSKAFTEWKRANPEFEVAYAAWREAKKAAEQELRIGLVGWGHCDNPDGMQALLRIKDSPRWRADCWDPEAIDPTTMRINGEQTLKATHDLRRLGIDGLDFATDGRWYLMANYG